MFGLVVFGLLGLYLILLIWATRYGYRWAQKKGWTGRKRWLGAAYGFLIVYLPVFWDWIPTLVTHQYYCATESGFWVYKTLEQWKQENPGVMETLVANKVWPHQKIDGKDTALINQRIQLAYLERNELLLNIWPDIRELIDSNNGEVLARYVGFSTSQMRRQAGWSGWKIWLDNEDCIGGRDKAIQFVKFVEQFKGAMK
ncbi:MAG: hypothetical protein A2V90_04475 [Gammaproteobacteria bacterium RBG_16_57_12]|nr:MAG: hypothetical protein A2V90_04475 [Gammaproteobacteria bacterium RBG_16_57_12]